MAKKKAKKKTAKSKKQAPKRKAAKKKVAKKKATKNKAAMKSPAGRAVAKSRSGNVARTPARKIAAKKRPVERRIRGKADIVDGVDLEERGRGAKFAGQSGDLQGLSDREEADSESVSELLEEGQSYEAEVVQGVENAKDPDQGEVRTHEVPEDDTPEEYRERDLRG